MPGKKKDLIAAKLGKHSRTVKAKNEANSKGPNVYDDVSEFFDSSISAPSATTESATQPTLEAEVEQAAPAENPAPSPAAAEAIDAEQSLTVEPATIPVSESEPAPVVEPEVEPIEETEAEAEPVEQVPAPEVDHCTKEAEVRASVPEAVQESASIEPTAEDVLPSSTLATIHSLSDPQVWQPQEQLVTGAGVASNNDDLSGLEKSLGSVVCNHFNQAHSIQLEADFVEQDQIADLADYLEAVADDESVQAFVDAHGHYFAVHYSRSFCQHFVGLFYGGELADNCAAPEVAKESLSDFDRHALTQLSRDIKEQLLEAIHYLQPESGDTGTGVNYSYTICKMQFQGKSADFHLRFILSESLVKHFMKSSNPNQDEEQAFDVSDLQLELDAVILQAKVDLSYILNLAPGDLIPMASNELVRLSINDEDILLGMLGNVNQQKVVRVTDKSVG